MKNFLLTLFVVLILAPCGLVRAQDSEEKKVSFPGLRKAMSEEEYVAAGIDKLSEDERAQLDKFIRAYVSAKSEEVAEKAATEAVDEAIKEKKVKTTAPEVIQGRIAGMFTGYTGRSVFTLQDGSKWAQSQHDSQYCGKIESPPVLIVKGQIGYRMYIAGCGDLRVQPVK